MWTGIYSIDLSKVSLSLFLCKYDYYNTLVHEWWHDSNRLPTTIHHSTHSIPVEGHICSYTCSTSTDDRQIFWSNGNVDSLIYNIGYVFDADKSLILESCFYISHKWWTRNRKSYLKFRKKNRKTSSPFSWFCLDTLQLFAYHFLSLSLGVCGFTYILIRSHMQTVLFIKKPKWISTISYFCQQTNDKI